eukprot:scaffold7176_cov145-Amphora_coffeaeformis.AAC.4
MEFEILNPTRGKPHEFGIETPHFPNDVRGRENRERIGHCEGHFMQLTLGHVLFGLNFRHEESNMRILGFSISGIQSLGLKKVDTDVFTQQVLTSAHSIFFGVPPTWLIIPYMPKLNNYRPRAVSKMRIDLPKNTDPYSPVGGRYHKLEPSHGMKSDGRSDPFDYPVHTFLNNHRLDAFIFLILWKRGSEQTTCPRT